MAKSMFLTRNQMRQLTGRAQRQTQIEALRKMIIPFYVRADGWPIVARVTIEGKHIENKEESKKKQREPWIPSVLLRQTNQR